MSASHQDCLLCRGAAGDSELARIQIWEDEHWRLTASLCAEVPGFCYLEPRRHISDITALDGEEARTFGEVLGRVSRVLREETGTERVYIYVFGDGIPHLHVHLAPHHAGDALNDQMVRGELVVQKLASGAETIVSKDFPPLPERELRSVAERVSQRLASN